MSVNQIVLQYLQFAVEQQRNIERLNQNIMHLNSRVSDIVNLYVNTTNLRDIGETFRGIIPSTETNSESTQVLSPSTEEFGADESSIPPIGRTLPRTPRTSHRRSSMPMNSVVNTPGPRPRTPAPIISDLRRSSIPSPISPISTSSITGVTGVTGTAGTGTAGTGTIGTETTGTGATGATSDNQEAFFSRNYMPENLRHASIFRNSQRHRVFRFSHQEPEDTVANLLNSTLLDSPVRIRPSATQIRQGTELLTWCDISDNYQTTCPIDLNLFEATDSILRIRQCSHIFREMNLRRHFRGSSSCPICRFDIRDYVDGRDTGFFTRSILETVE
jgi:hypothetical protein